LNSDRKDKSKLQTPSGNYASRISISFTIRAVKVIGSLEGQYGIATLSLCLAGSQPPGVGCLKGELYLLVIKLLNSMKVARSQAGVRPAGVSLLQGIESRGRARPRDT
jgi:hypothetical protein